MERERSIPDEIAPRTSDLALVQILAETRVAAARRADEEGEHGDQRWRTLADRTDRILRLIGVEIEEAGHTPAIGFDRIDRTAIDLGTADADRVAATLRALHDRPDDDRLDAADRTLDDLEDLLA